MMTDARSIEVLVIGEALIDIVDSGSWAAEHVGGSPANVALGLGRRGVRTALLTQIAPDARGEAIVEYLRDAGVETLPESFVLEHTSTASAQLAADGSADYGFDISWLALPPMSPIEARVLHTGSIAAFLEPGANSVRDVLSRSSATYVTFDPNVRPALMPEHALAVEAFEFVAARAAVVKLSDEDAEWLYPDRGIDEVIDALLGSGPALVAVTLGSDGAVMASAGARIRVPGVKTRVVDTVGAGDTFMASLIASLLTENIEELDAAALNRFGTAATTAAAITVSRAGADLPWAAELL